MLDLTCRSGYVIIAGRTVCADSIQTGAQSLLLRDTTSSGSSDGAE